MNNILLEVNFLGISKMNIFRRLVFILVLILIAGCVTTEQSVSDPSQLTGQTIEPAFMTISVPPPKERVKLAIAGFENKSTYSSDKLWDTSSQLLSSQLLEMGYFRVVEWERMKALFDWRELSTLSIVKSPEVRRKARKILLTEYFIIGAITSFDVNQKSQVSALSKSKVIETTIRIDLLLQDAMTW